MMTNPSPAFDSSVRASRRHFEAERMRRGETPSIRDGWNSDESLARTYERPALRKPFAAFPADSKVA
jgi:hypothetical protein